LCVKLSCDETAALVVRDRHQLSLEAECVAWGLERLQTSPQSPAPD